MPKIESFCLQLIFANSLIRDTFCSLEGSYSPFNDISKMIPCNAHFSQCNGDVLKWQECFYCLVTKDQIVTVARSLPGMWVVGPWYFRSLFVCSSLPHRSHSSRHTDSLAQDCCGATCGSIWSGSMQHFWLFLFWFTGFRSVWGCLHQCWPSWCRLEI